MKISSLSILEKTGEPKYTLFCKSEEEETEETQSNKSKSIIGPFKVKKKKQRRKTRSSKRSTVPDGPPADNDKPKEEKKQKRTRSLEDKPEDPNYTLFHKAGQEKKEEEEPTYGPNYTLFKKDPSEDAETKLNKAKQEPGSSADEKGSAQYALLKKKEAAEKEKKLKYRRARSLGDKTESPNYKLFEKAGQKKKEETKDKEKNGPNYTLFKNDPSEEDLNNTTIIVQEDIFKGDGDDVEERTVEARLEIQKESSQNLGENDMFNYDLSIDIDPAQKDHVSVDVHGQVDGRTMNVLTHAATEGKGTADVRAEIQYGNDKDEDEVELTISDDSSDEMKLRAGRNRKQLKSSGKGKKGSNSDN